MEEVYNTNQLNKDIETISEVVDRFYNMIWCQQDNSFNFDKLNKAEQIQLIGMYKDAAQLKSDLLMYGDNQNLPYDIAEAMHRVIEASGANLRIVIDELSQYLPEYPDDNGLLKEGGA